MLDDAVSGFNVVLAAAGSGLRMGSRVAKQYLPLLDTTVIECTLQRLLSMEQVNHIVVAVNDLAMYSQYVASRPRVSVVLGGNTRAESVSNALQYISANEGSKINPAGSGKQYPVMVHDAARPCVRAADIRLLMEVTALSQDGGLLAIPVSDTLKRAGENHNVQATIDRTSMWRAATPQLFQLDLLIDALEQCRKQSVAVTDESSAMEYCGYSPRLIACHDDNIKVTLPTDLKLAQSILEAQERE